MVGHHKVDDSDNGILFTEDYNYDCMENEQDAPDARSDNFMFDDFSAEDSDNIVFEDSDGEDSDNFVLDSSPEKKAGVTPTHLPAVTQNLSTPLTKRIPFERSSLNKQQSLASASSLPPAPPTVPKPNAPLNGLQHSKHANPPATPSASSTTRNINASSQPPKVESTPPPKKLAPPTTEHPVAHFYPSAPSILFDSSQPKQQLQYLRNISSGYINSQLQVHNRNGVVHAEITVSTKHFGVIVSEAQDQDSITATSAAVATLITKLNASGCLQDVLLPLTLSKATPQEVDACAHLPKLIYEYGASLNAIPNVTHCTVSPRYVTSSNTQFFGVSVSILAIDVQSYARARTPRQALILAAQGFAKEMDRRNLTLQSSVTVAQAEQLARQHFGKRNTTINITFVSDMALAQVICQGQTVTAPVYGISRAAATKNAWLAAAVVLGLFSQKFPGAPTSVPCNNRAPDIYGHPIDPKASQLTADMLRNLGPQATPLGWTADGANRDEDRGFGDLTLSPDEIEDRNAELVSHLKSLHSESALTKGRAQIKQQRAELTINQHREEVLKLVTNNEYSILVSGTGSGKTTQLPQILLDDAIKRGNGAHCNIICTQPRKIAATSVARRVGVERKDGTIRSVGHQVRFDSNPPKPGGSINYCTTGILLAKMQASPTEALDNISHVIVDETHERDINIDSLLALLKAEIRNRKASGLTCPKIIMASATLDVELFSKYFMQTDDGGVLRPCPSLSIPGRVFEVEHRYLDDLLKDLEQYSTSLLTKDKHTENFLKAERALGHQQSINGKSSNSTPSDQELALIPYALIALTIAHIVKTSAEGAILVFLPGLPEINNLAKLMSAESPVLGVNFDDESKYKIILLHGSLPDAQTEVFESVTKGCRKIILSTNVAETSITIPDVKYVVDTGKHKKKTFDPERNVTELPCVWISKSSAKQRAGRAGRVRNGFYYALYSKQRLEQFCDTELPEIKCSDLQEVCLTVAALIHSYKIPVRNFLQTWIEPPSAVAVDAAMSSLKAMGALTQDEEVTALGRVLSALNVHPAIGKMVLLGLVFRCLDPMIILAASNGMKDMFVRPPGEAGRHALFVREGFSGDSRSDQLALIKAFDQVRSYVEAHGESRTRTWLNSMFIHHGSLRELYRVAEQMEQTLIDLRLMPRTIVAPGYWMFGPREVNTNSTNEPLIKALMISGFYPNIAASFDAKMMRTLHANKATMSNQSINSINKIGGRPRGSVYTFSELSKQQGGLYMCRNTTAVSPLMVMLFGQSLKRASPTILDVDGWLQFRHDDTQHTETILKLKDSIDIVLANAFGELQKEHGEDRYLHHDPVRNKLVDLMGSLFAVDEKSYVDYLIEQAKLPQPVQPKRKNRKKGGYNKR